MFQKGNDIGKATQFKKGNKVGGRKPKLSKVIKDMPKDAQEKIYAVLWTAISMHDVKEARTYIDGQITDMPECGFVLQIAIKALLGKNGMMALNDILNRLFGKPRMTTEIRGAEDFAVNIQVPDAETAEALKKIMEG